MALERNQAVILYDRWYKTSRGAMFLVRFVGSIFLLIATLSLIHDGSLTLARGDGLLVTPLGQHWQDISPSSLEAIRDIVRETSQWIWDAPITLLLGYPSWIIFGIIGIAICYAGRNRKRTNIFAN